MKYENFRKWYEEGARVSDIASAAGVSTQTVYMYLKKQGAVMKISNGVRKNSEEKVQKLYAIGLTVREICEQLGIAKQTVYRHLRLQGIKLEGGAARAQLANRKVKPEKEPEVERMYREGTSAFAIARLYGCNAAVIYRILKTRGVPRRQNLSAAGRKGGLTPHVSRGKQAWYQPTNRQDGFGVGLLTADEAKRDYAERKLALRTKPAAVIKTPPPIQTATADMKGSGRARPRPVSLRGFPPLPGEPGYVYEEAA